METAGAGQGDYEFTIQLVKHRPGIYYYLRSQRPRQIGDPDSDDDTSKTFSVSRDATVAEVVAAFRKHGAPSWMGDFELCKQIGMKVEQAPEGYEEPIVSKPSSVPKPSTIVDDMDLFSSSIDEEKSLESIEGDEEPALLPPPRIAPPQANPLPVLSRLTPSRPEIKERPKLPYEDDPDFIANRLEVSKMYKAKLAREVGLESRAQPFRFNEQAPWNHSVD